jgi:hypothetical protein
MSGAKKEIVALDYLFFVVLLLIEVIHRALKADSDKGEYRIAKDLKAWRHICSLLVSPLTKNVIDLMTAAEVASDTESQTGVVGALEKLCDVFKAIMATIATLCPHSQLAKWQGDIINDNEQVLLLNLQLLQPVSHGLTRKIHIG